MEVVWEKEDFFIEEKCKRKRSHICSTTKTSRVGAFGAIPGIPGRRIRRRKKLGKRSKLVERKLLKARCNSLLVEKIADSELEYIKGKTKIKPTPKAIWTTLKNMFAKKGISGQFYLLK